MWIGNKLKVILLDSLIHDVTGEFSSQYSYCRLFYINEVISLRIALLLYLIYRAAAVDSSGRELNRNRLIALLSAIVLEQVNVT